LYNCASVFYLNICDGTLSSLDANQCQVMGADAGSEGGTAGDGGTSEGGAAGDGGTSEGGMAGDAGVSD
jgi:hypothetical protein